MLRNRRATIAASTPATVILLVLLLTLTGSAAVLATTPTPTDTPTITPTPPCAFYELTFMSFVDAGAVRFQFTNIPNWPISIRGFQINWESYFPNMTLARIAVGGATPTAPEAVEMWNGASTASPTVGDDLSAGWVASPTIAGGESQYIWVDFDGTDQNLFTQFPGVAQASDFYGTRIVLSNGCMIEANPIDTPTALPTASPSPTSTASVTPTAWPTITMTRTPTRTMTRTPMPTMTRTPTYWNTSTPIGSKTPTRTPTRTMTKTVTRTATFGPTLTKTPTRTMTVAPTTPTTTTTLTPPVLAAPVVTTLQDDFDGYCTLDHCSLREAISQAANGAIISFAPGLTGTLYAQLGKFYIGGTGYDGLPRAFTINGPGAQALNISGGTFYICEGNPVVHFRNLTLSGVIDPLYGAILACSSTDVTLDKVVIRDNQTTVGGAISNHGYMLITNSSLINNQATSNGGAIYNAGTLAIANSTLYGNMARDGGGLYLVNGTLDMYNVTVIGNGLLYPDLDGNLGGNLTIRGIPYLDIKNTILADPAPYGSNCNIPIASGNNFIAPAEDESCGGLNQRGVSRLSPLTLNSNGTYHLAPLASSLAIDQGDNAVCANLLINNLDQRGVSRPLDAYGIGGEAKCDIGAVESTLDDLQTPTSTPTPTSTGISPSTFTPAPTATFTVTATGTVAVTPSPTMTTTSTPSVTASVTGAPTATKTATATDTVTATFTPSITKTRTGTPTRTATGTRTPTFTPSGTRTPTITRTATITVTAFTKTATRTPTIKPSGTRTPTIKPSGTRTPTITRTATLTPSPTNLPGTFRTETVGVYRPSAGRFYLRNSNNAGPVDFNLLFGVSTDLPIVGDWNGDGVETIGVFRPSNATFFLKDQNTQSAPVAYQFAFGMNGDIPVAGDWDGDGRDSIGVFRPSNRVFYLRNSLSTGGVNAWIALGTVGDLPIVGDWNGDGKDTPGVFRPTMGRFYLSNTYGCIGCAGAVAHIVYFGYNGESPLAGDFNGDGIATVGAFKLGTFRLKNTHVGSGTDLQFTFGTTGDKPIIGTWGPTGAPSFIPRR